MTCTRYNDGVKLCRGGQRNFSDLALVAMATVGVTELIKNFIQKGGKRIWSLVTIVVGVGMSFIAFYLPEKVLYSIVGVSGATIFYDTIYKSFEKLFKKNDTGDEEGQN